MSPTRRLLVLCANLTAVRSRLLPQQFGRWASLLQAGGGGKELQAAAQACAAELEAVETRLAGAYIDRKQVGRWCGTKASTDAFSCAVHPHPALCNLCLQSAHCVQLMSVKLWPSPILFRPS